MFVHELHSSLLKDHPVKLLCILPVTLIDKQLSEIENSNIKMIKFSRIGFKIYRFIYIFLPAWFVPYISYETTKLS